MARYSGQNQIFLQLFDQFKNEQAFGSDAKAADAIGLHRRDISHYRKGDSRPDVYACTRLAIATKRDPITLIAEVEAAKETDSTRGRFWRDFFQRVTASGFIPVLIFTGSFALESTDGRASTETMTHKVTLYEAWQRLLRVLRSYHRRHRG